MNGEPGQALWQALAPRLPAAAHGAALEQLERFGLELSQYAELVVGGGAVGFLVRGDGAALTARMGAALRALGLPEEALTHHAALAEWFEHLRAFLKVEWRGAHGAPSAGVYFRRRPRIEAVLDWFARRGVVASVCAELSALAQVLGKSTVHFVAASLQPGALVQHKLYFSQLVVPERAEALEVRLQAACERVGLDAARWLAPHREMLREVVEDTLYVSCSFTEGALLPTLKVDYSNVAPVQVAVWAAPERAAQVQLEARQVAEAMGARRLAYLGVRLGSESWPHLKYYADRASDSAPLEEGQP